MPTSSKSSRTAQRKNLGEIHKNMNRPIRIRTGNELALKTGPISVLAYHLFRLMCRPKNPFSLGLHIYVGLTFPPGKTNIFAQALDDLGRRTNNNCSKWLNTITLAASRNVEAVIVRSKVLKAFSIDRAHKTISCPPVLQIRIPVKKI